MTRAALATALFLVLAGTMMAATWSRPARRTYRQETYRHQYVKKTFGPKAVVRSAGFAEVNQLRNHPHEWGGGGGGFGKRFASAFGTHVVNNSIKFGVGSLRHEELSYRPSGKDGFGPRLKYALENTVITHKTTTGRKTVAAGNLSGAFGSGMISRAWQPASTRTVAGGVASGGITLGVEASSHVAAEFWPHHHRPKRRS